MSWLAIWAVTAAIVLIAAALFADRSVPWRAIAGTLVCALLWPLLIPLALIAVVGIGFELLRPENRR